MILPYWPGRRFDPLERMEEKGKPFSCKPWEARKVDGLHFLATAFNQLVSFRSQACGFNQADVLVWADVCLLQEILDHQQPDLLPPRPKGGLKSLGLPPFLWPQVNEGPGVLKIVQVSLMAHDAATDRGEDVKHKIDVHHAAQEDQHHSEGDTGDATDAVEAEPMVLRARAVLLRKAQHAPYPDVILKEVAVESTRGLPIEALQGRQEEVDLHYDATKEHDDPHDAHLEPVRDHGSAGLAG
mmetsp:Transcript_22482/g.62390  ORF Transcript_22482/g.62390 Transcript_22482/m.62390 type:complete len:241 (+) Transcript_22482:1336-2058(+)